MEIDFFENKTNRSNLDDVDQTHLVEDSLVTGKQDGGGYVSSNFEIKRVKWLFIVVLLVFGFVVFRLGSLQIARGDVFRLAAEENRVRIHEIKATRGIIYDRNNKILAYNIPNFILSFIPADLPKDENELRRLASEISSILGYEELDINDKLVSETEYLYKSIIIEEHIPYDQAILLKIASKNQPGIILEVSNFRKYSTTNNFSHVLGYTGKVTENDITEYSYSYDDFIGKSGIELFYEDILKGQHGKKEVEVNSLGKESKILNSTSSIPGKNIKLTIDSDLQNLLGDEINKQYENSKSISGAAAIALDPRNGEVLALVSSPRFSNNDFTLGISQKQYDELVSNESKPLFNRAISGEYPSGSTIKPLIALAALEEGIINEHTSILSVGGIKIDKWYFPDWKAGGHGATNVTKAIAESVNTFFYTIGGGNNDFDGLGVNVISTYLGIFGLGNILGIDLNGEASGFIPSRQWKEEIKGERWYIGDTYHLSIGQGDILVTPLQVASYTAALANGGTFYKPKLLKSSSNAKNEAISENIPAVVNSSFAANLNIEIIRNGLRQAVLTGSAKSLLDLPVSSAGKTGTAQFGTENKTHSWFTSFAPFDNPEIVITVIIEGGGEGNDTALPVTKKALNYWFSK